MKKIVLTLLFLALALGCGSVEKEEHLGTANSSYTNSTSYVNLMNRLRPFAAYQFDLDVDTVAKDTGLNGGNHPGQYHYENPNGLGIAPVQWVPGIVTSVNPAQGGSNNAAHINTPDGNVSNNYSDDTCPIGNCNDNTKYYGNYVEIPVPNKNRDFTITKAWDNFNGTDTTYPNTWGIPTDGNGTSTQFSYQGANRWTTIQSGAQCLTYPCYEKHTIPGYWSVGHINETAAFGWWGQIFPVPRLDSDVSVKVWWDNTTTSSALYPLILASRYTDGNNYYSAQLFQGARSGSANTNLYLATAKRQNGVWSMINTQTIPSALITASPPSSYWNVRFQVVTNHDGTDIVTLNAKAWPDSIPQPASWLIHDQHDGTSAGGSGTTPLQGVNSAVLSYNPGGLPNVYFRNFRMQSPGMSISAWIRPTTDTFNGSNTVLENCTTELENYTYPINKLTDQVNQDWAFRLYPQTAACAGSPGNNRNDMMAAYIWGNNAGPGGLGAGNRFWNGVPGISPNFNYSLYGVNNWRHVVAVFDAGDMTDPGAGVTAYLNGYPQGVGTGSLYSGYSVDLTPGDQPVRLGASWTGANSLFRGNNWTQFNGDLDEVLFFDYKLSSAQVGDLFQYRDLSQTLQ